MIHVPPTRKINSFNPITSKTSSYYIIRLCLKSRILSLRALNPVQLWWGSSHTTFLLMWRPRTKETNYLPLYTCICSLVYMYTTIYKRQDNHNRQSCSKRRIKMKDIGLLVSGNELRSSHFTLIKSKSWTTWKINTSFGIPKREEDTRQTAALRLNRDRWIQAVIAYQSGDSQTESTMGTTANIGKPEL